MKFVRCTPIKHIFVQFALVTIKGNAAGSRDQQQTGLKMYPFKSYDHLEFELKM